MFSKNLKYYRLQKNMTKKELASKVDVTPMAISYYESGERRPNMEIIKRLADVLEVRVTDFINSRNTDLVFAHGEFRKNSSMTKTQQEFIRESVEEYLSRFYTAVDILGGEVIPAAPGVHQIKLSGDSERDARQMRHYLRLAESGPVGNLIELLENRGILVYVYELENKDFSGMNGLVNERPYIIVNGTMSPERIRSTVVHEMAHFLFKWDSEMDDKEIERVATAISGAFLFPKDDAIRELGIRRSAITKDMALICKEYGISMYLLVKRAALCGIINQSVEKDFYIRANQIGWRTNEPIRITREEPMLFSQLVFRAVCENEITVQKGAELLKKPYEYVAEHCFAEGD